MGHPSSAHRFDNQTPPKWYPDQNTAVAPRRASATSRFLRAAIVAIGLYLLLGSLIRSSSLLDWMEPSDHLQETSSTFHLPFNDTSALFFHSTGDSASGCITFLPTEDLSDKKDEIIVDTTVRFWPTEPFDEPFVSKKQRDDGWGLVFHGGHGNRHGYNRRTFNVEVRLPVMEDELLKLGTLETDLPIFVHRFDTGTGHVAFNSVQVRGGIAPLHATYLTAKVVDVWTSDAGISGTFNVTDSLVLHTSNGAINVHISASNGDWKEPTNIDLVTSNAHIQAEASFFGTANKETQNQAGFHMFTESSNGLVDVKIPVAPADSHIAFSGKTSNARAGLTLPPAFEGTISGSTSPYMRSDFIYHDTRNDPSGQERTRTISELTSRRGTFKVRTWWADESDNVSHGNATVTTSNGHIAVIIV